MRTGSGYAIPLSLMVGSVAFLLGVSAAQLAAGDLHSATHLYHQERARQAADYALEYAVVAGVPQGPAESLESLGSDGLRATVGGPSGGLIVRGAAVSIPSGSGTHPEDRGKVTVYDNRAGTLPADSGCPVRVPVGFQYWVAEGEAVENGRVKGHARVGALVRVGHSAGSSGAQVQYLTQRDRSLPVHYRAEDLTGQVAESEVVCATNATEFHPLTGEAPLFLNSVAEFGGMARIPRERPDTWVSTAAGSASVNLDRNGGLFNLPPYSPPALEQYFVEHVARSELAQPALPPGRYERWEMGSSTVINLNGTYHVGELRLRADDSRLVAVGATRLFVDRIVVSNADHWLGLKNNAGGAGGFKIQVKPPQRRQSLRLSMGVNALGESSSVLFLAPNFNLEVLADRRKTIKGSFACEELHLNYPAGEPGPGYFVYDVSANQARRLQSAEEGRTPDSRTSGFWSDPDPGEPGLENARAPEEPLILSKQEF